MAEKLNSLKLNSLTWDLFMAGRAKGNMRKVIYTLLKQIERLNKGIDIEHLVYSTLFEVNK